MSIFIENQNEKFATKVLLFIIFIHLFSKQSIKILIWIKRTVWITKQWNGEKYLLHQNYYRGLFFWIHVYFSDLLILLRIKSFEGLKWIFAPFQKSFSDKVHKRYRFQYFCTEKNSEPEMGIDITNLEHEHLATED